MKAAALVEQRRKNWSELERLCGRMRFRRVSRPTAEVTARFAALYRAACADLALADAYQLPPNTVQYLHRLVGRAHSQLYPSRAFRFSRWAEVLLTDVPQRIFRDRCVHLAMLLFWGSFGLGALLAHQKTWWPTFVEDVVRQEQIDSLEAMYRDPLHDRAPAEGILMAGYYISHNTGIGVNCFVGGLFVVPGLFVTLFNGLSLGAMFGYMARPEVAASPNFYEFVTAHGPFELNAIGLSAGAGLRLGLAWIKTDGLSRADSLRRAGVQVLPVLGAAVVLFLLAALIEGFLSPSAAPLWLKQAVAAASSAMMALYFVVLGFPRGRL